MNAVNTGILRMNVCVSVAFEVLFKRAQGKKLHGIVELVMKTWKCSGG
jgi:hypothetical protein